MSYPQNLKIKEVVHRTMTPKKQCGTHPSKLFTWLIYKEKRDLSTEQASPYLLLLCINLYKRRIQRISHSLN